MPKIVENALVAWTTARPGAKQMERVQSAFSVAHDRTLDHGPRFGLVVLSEVASRALSPALSFPEGSRTSIVRWGAMARGSPQWPNPV